MNKSKRNRSKSIQFKNLGLEGYFKLLRIAFRHPKLYISSIPLDGGLRQPVVFFIINFALGLFLRVLIAASLSESATLFFLGITSIVFFTPLAILGLFGVTLILHLIAKILLGKGTFESTIRAISYPLILVLFFWIPVLNIISGIFVLYLLTLSFQRVHQYNMVKAALNIAIPFLLIIILSFILGLLSSTSILTV